jgi:hypothetical protein
MNFYSKIIWGRTQGTRKGTFDEKKVQNLVQMYLEENGSKNSFLHTGFEI